MFPNKPALPALITFTISSSFSRLDTPTFPDLTDTDRTLLRTNFCPLLDLPAALNIFGLKYSTVVTLTSSSSLLCLFSSFVSCRLNLKNDFLLSSKGNFPRSVPPIIEPSSSSPSNWTALITTLSFFTWKFPCCVINGNLNDFLFGKH